MGQSQVYVLLCLRPESFKVFLVLFAHWASCVSCVPCVNFLSEREIETRFGKSIHLHCFLSCLLIRGMEVISEIFRESYDVSAHLHTNALCKIILKYRVHFMY